MDPPDCLTVVPEVGPCVGVVLELLLLGTFCPPELFLVTVPLPCPGVLSEATSPGLRTPEPVGTSIFPELLGLTCVVRPLVGVLVLTVSRGLFTFDPPLLYPPVLFPEL